MNADTPMPMTVVTGFLGSGKTTLIANLLRRPEMARAAVIINEFGEIGLDHELIESSEEDLVELSTGCLCCVMRGDLTNAVHRLMEKRDQGRPIDRIVLETTGLADPAPIVHAAITDPALRSLVNLDRVAVTVDALTAHASLEAHEESRSQVALADVLLITKTDIDDGDVESLLGRIRVINPDAEAHFPVQGDLDPEVIIGENTNQENRSKDRRRAGGVVETSAHHHAHSHGPDEITSVSLRLENPMPAVALTLFLQALAETLGQDLLRLKGIVEVAEAPDSPAIVHGVRHVFHPMRWLDAWPGGAPDSRLVLIGRGVAEPWIRVLLDTIIEEVAEASGQ